jgi:methyl-accepting chemotaxis protein
MAWYRNLKTGTKMIGGFLAVAVILVILGILSYNSLNSVHDDLLTIRDANLMPLTYLSGVNEEFLYLRGNIYKYMVMADARESLRQEAATRIATLNQHLTQLQQSQLEEDEAAELLTF